MDVTYRTTTTKKDETVIKKQDGSPAQEIVVFRDYFGLQPGQTLQQFVAEVKALSPEDRAELLTGAALELGYVVEP